MYYSLVSRRSPPLLGEHEVPVRAWKRVGGDENDENEFDLHENGRAGETHFHMNGFPRRLVLTQRQKVTRKRPITKTFHVLRERKEVWNRITMLSQLTAKRSIHVLVSGFSTVRQQIIFSREI